MYATIILGIFSVLFAYLARYKNTRWGLKVSFTLIFLFLALRYNFGNDYQTYLDAFIAIQQYNDINVFFLMLQQFEPGWIFLNWLFRPLGFFAMTAVIASLNCIVYYRFIKKHLPVQYYWLGVFIYIFSPVLMLVHASGMRQSIAIMLFIFSLDYLYKKDAIRYFLCIGLASLFHLSALVMLPVYLVGLFNWKINKATGIIIFSIFMILYFFGPLIAPHVEQITDYFPKYAGRHETAEFGTGLGTVYLSGLLILILYFERLQNRQTSLVFKMAIISIMLLPLNLINELSHRLAMYFAIGTIIVYPTILRNLKNPPIKIIYLTTLIFFAIYKFFQLFYSETDKDYYAIYQTIFSAPQWY